MSVGAEQQFFPMTVLSPRRHVAMSGDIFGYHNSMLVTGI